MTRTALFAGSTMMALAVALGRPEAAHAQDAVAFGVDEWTYGTGPLSAYHFQYGTGPVSDYWLRYAVEPGSLYHLLNGTDVLSAYWWLNATGPGSAYFWHNGTEAGSQYWWHNGAGCLSEAGWRTGARCGAASARFVVTLCIARAIELEPCAAVEATLAEWLPGQDGWYVGGGGASGRVEDMRAAVGR